MLRENSSFLTIFSVSTFLRGLLNTGKAVRLNSKICGSDLLWSVRTNEKIGLANQKLFYGLYNTAASRVRQEVVLFSTASFLENASGAKQMGRI